MPNISMQTISCARRATMSISEHTPSATVADGVVRQEEIWAHQLQFKQVPQFQRGSIELPLCIWNPCSLVSWL